MATTQTSSIGSGQVPYRVTVRQFSKMIDANVLPEGARVELLGGILVAMTTNFPHDFIVTRLANLPRSLLPGEWSLREEKSVRLGRYWRSQPDITILRGQDKAFVRRAPRSVDIGLLVEVADSSYPKDSGLKLKSYAAARVPVYWIVNVERRQIEVHTVPTGRGAQARYEVVAIHPATGQPSVLLDGQDLGTIAVAELFP